MATPTYTLIDSVTVSDSTTTTVSFSGITGDYRDLVLVYSGDPTLSVGIMRFNSDSGSNYNNVYMAGNGSTTISGTGGTSAIRFQYYEGGGDSAGVLGIAQIMDYSATDKHKTVLVRSNSADDGVTAVAGRWGNTAAITQIDLLTPSASFYFGNGDTIYLYGIEA